MRKLRILLLLFLCFAVPVLLVGCEGDDGATGAPGAPGEDGAPGAPGPGALANETCNLCHGEGKIADVAVEHDTFTGTVDIQINDASFNTVDNTAAVTFTVVSATDANGSDVTDTVASALTEVDTNDPPRLAHMRFTIARLIPGVIYGPDPNNPTGREPDSWNFYGPRSHRTASQLVDNGGGSFTFTFVDEVALDPAEVGFTHRVGIEIYNLPSGLRSVNPTFDFVPDGVTPPLTREIVVTANCNECHDPLGYTPRFHGSRRVEIKHCVLCHNPNNGLAPESVGGDPVPIPFVKLVHAIHTSQSLNIFEDDENEGDFSEVTFPQDIRNCTKCHRGGADSDNWKTRPTMEACGSCHTDVDFAAGIAGGHDGGVQTSNSGCIVCHQPDSGGVAPPISVVHRTENVTPNNQELPTGLSRFEYFIDNVAVDNNGVATVEFRITQDGAPFDLQTWEDGVGTTFTDRTPTFLLAWAKSQDGIDEPAEYNNIESLDPPSSSTGNGAGDAAAISIGDLWNAGNITGDSAGYTATLLDNTWMDPNRSFPEGATMRAVALQSYFRQIVGGEEIGRHAPSVMKPVTGDAVRRQVVKSGYDGDPALGGQPFGCLECHETLELHGGSRVNNPQVCVFCHNPNKSSSGRTADPAEPSCSEGEDPDCDPEEDPFVVLGTDPLEWPEATNNFKNMIHGIHKASSRPYEFVRNRLNGIYYNWDHVTFPGDLMDCTKCHIGEAYVPSNVPANTLWNVERTTTGDPNETREDIIEARSSVPNFTDLVDSPIAGACFYCHDDGPAKSHILLQGGKLSIWPDIETADGVTTREDALGLP